MTKTNIRKRTISILLILMVMLTMTPMTASAAEPEWTTVNSYEELQTAVKAKKEYIKLGQDIDTTNFHSTGSGLEVEDWLTFENQTCTLDLNGKTLTLMTRLLTMGVFLRVYDGSNLTIKDSSSAKTGAITGAFKNYIASDAGCCLFHVHGGSSLTLENGSFTVTSEPHESNADTVRAMDSNITIKEGVTISHPGKFYPEHSYKVLDGNSYALRTDGKCKVIIDGGVFDGHVKLSGYQDTNGSVQINKGTFKKDVQVLYTAEENNSNPAVTVNGGTFEGNAYLQYWPWKTSLYMPYRLNGGTFKGTVDLYADDGIYEKDKPTGNPNIAMGLDKCFGYSAVVTQDAVFTGPNAYTAVLSEKLTADHYEYYKMWLKGTASNPVRIIPNAWGMKSVTLDGNPIDYAKDWNGGFEELNNDEAHTLKFTWKPLAQELKDAGYSYRANFDCYTVGSNTPTTSVPISATATEYSHTIPAGAAPSVYPFDLQLNLDKNGSSVGIISNEHIVKLVVSEAPPVLDTFISTVSFRLAKTDIGEPGKLSFEATDKNGNTVAIHPNVTWDPDKIVEGINHVSFTIPAPEGYTFVGENGKVTTLKFGGVDVIGYVDSTGALNFSFPLEVPHQHKAASVGYNAKYHWKVCSCGQKIMNTSEKHTMSAWVEGDTLSGGGVEYTRSCTLASCGYKETTIDYSGVKHVTSLVLNMENYPMDGMRPHNFVKNGSETKDSDGEYLLTERDNSILYPSFSITSGNDKAKLYAMNPESYTVRADNPDFAKWSSRGSLLAPECDDASHDTHNDKSTFTTGVKYGVRLFLEAENGYAFYKDFNEASNFKLFTDMNGIEVETYRVEAWYYKNTEGVDDWIMKAPADDSAGASKVRVLFQLTAKNEGDLNITLPELKAGDDLKETWAYFEGTSNSGTGTFVNDCYGKTSATMAWTGGPSCVIHNNTVTGESVTAQAGQTYTLTIPPVNENVLAHITIKNPTAASKIVEIPSGAIIVTYKLPAAADDTIVNGAAVSITPPAYGDTPSTTATVAGTAHCTASAVTWNPADATFGEKAYTATVTLTAETDYTFANDAVFTINGHAANVAKNADGSVTLSYTFPKLTAPHAHDYTGQLWLYLDPGNHYQECKAKDGGFNIAAHTFSAWVNNGNGTQSRHCTICKMADGSAYTETAPYTPPASSGGYVPTVQKPEITIIGSGKADLSADGRTATITAAAGHELVSVVLNGKEMGKVEKLTGLKTGDKATITFQAKTDGKAEMDKMTAQKASKLKLMARSAKTAKKNIKVVVKGDLKAITDAGYTVKYKFYRSTKKSAGYKAMLTKKAPTYYNTYGKKGTMYYYKARVMIYDKDGNFVAQTALKQCKYANRLWTK